MNKDESTEEEKARRAECRWAVLAELAARAAVATHHRTVARALNAGHAADYEDAEVLAALEFLAGFGLATRHPDPMGAAIYWRITSAGTLANERGSLALD